MSRKPRHPDDFREAKANLPRGSSDPDGSLREDRGFAESRSRGGGSKPAWRLAVAVLALLVALPVAADVRMVIFVPDHGGEPVQDAVAVLVEETGGDVLFKGDDNRFLVVRMQEESVGVLTALALGLYYDHTCVGWEEPCSSLPILVDLQVTPQGRQNLLDLVDEFGGTADSETLLNGGDSYFSLSVPVEALGPIDLIEGVHDWRFQAVLPLLGRVLNLGEGYRFTATAEWETSTSAGTAQARFLTRDTGAFYFFRPDNLELIVKVLDGCPVNGYYWVFVSGLTNVGVKLRVGHFNGFKDYENPLGKTFETVADTAAIPCL